MCNAVVKLLRCFKIKVALQNEARAGLVLFKSSAESVPAWVAWADSVSASVGAVASGMDCSSVMSPSSSMQTKDSCSKSA